ncbi:MAG: hypothetical protein ACTHK3_13205 [Solirubrobacterales bacterium]
MDLLDRLDDRRHDTLAILDAANEFGQLTDAEQDATEGGLEGYAGLDEAQHPFTSLLRESHNSTYVLRDLDGSLQLLWQESSISDRWSRGPLHRENLIDDGALEDLLEEDPDWLAEMPLSAEELSQLLAELPNADGPVMSF